MEKNDIFKRLDEVEQKYLKIEETLSDPDISPKDIARYSKERSSMADLVDTYRLFKQTLNEIEESKELLAEKELAELAKHELTRLEQELEEIRQKLQILLLPKDPNDEKNAFLEVRAGTGGDEAALFAATLFRMYTRYAERKGWKVEIMNINETGIGGIKEGIAGISGKGVYGSLKFESGVHRVQRIPTTEAGGRIHTSTATVAVIAEPDEVDEVEIDEKELRIDTYRSSGPGGQHVNKTDSAVRITHIPTGIVTQCQDERSQHKNRTKAMRMLRAKLFELKEEKRRGEVEHLRKSIVGTGGRSEKIRTYNFPQTRLTDHRIGLTLHKLEAILEGDLDDLVEALKEFERAEQIKQFA